MQVTLPVPSAVLQARLAEECGRAVLPRSRGVAVEPAELEKGAAAADAAAVKLLDSRPELRHLLFSMKAVGLTMRQVGAGRQAGSMSG